MAESVVSVAGSPTAVTCSPAADRSWVTSRSLRRSTASASVCRLSRSSSAVVARRSARDGPEAVRLATRACELTGYNTPGYVDTLAAACAVKRPLTKPIAPARSWAATGCRRLCARSARARSLRVIYLTVGSELPDYSDLLPHMRGMASLVSRRASTTWPSPVTVRR